jgi:hypothetical protein
MDPASLEAVAVATESPYVDSGYSPSPAERRAVRAAWTRDIAALCQALDAQQRAHFTKVAEPETTSEPELEANGPGKHTHEI